MTRRFNTVGACHPDHHYILDAKERLPQVKSLVDQSGCFWVYGPRQTGKTTAMRQWAIALSKRGKYAALLMSAGSLAEGRVEDTEPTGAIAEESFLYELREAASAFPEDCQPPDWGYQVAGQRIRAALSVWAEACPRPLVLFIDDVDALDGRSLTLLLRQLGSGLRHRPRPFPQAIALIGLQDVNSMPIESITWTPGNLFHQFRTTTLALQSFTLEDVANVYQKHTDTTGQLFTLEAVDRAYELTQGQPWLVNAVGQYAIEHTQSPIEPLHIEAAANHLLQHQILHQTLPLDHLSSRLIQFRDLLAPMLAEEICCPSSNQQVLDAVASGLCRLDAAGGLVLANPLYRELVMQQLALPAIASLGYLESPWLNVDGTVNIRCVWETLVQLWRAQGDAIMQAVLYETVAPYVAMLAFFHRLTQPNGVLNPTYGFQQQQMRLAMTLKTPSMSINMMVQLMVWHDEQPNPMAIGVSQLERLLDESPAPTARQTSEPHGALIIIDQRRDRPPCQERTHMDSITTATGLSVPLIRG